MLASQHGSAHLFQCCQACVQLSLPLFPLQDTE